MSNRSEELTKWHNLGQTQAATPGSFEAPHGVGKGVVTSGEESKQDIEDNAAHLAGWRHGRSQQGN